jgi:hypothetical protein
MGWAWALSSHLYYAYPDPFATAVQYTNLRNKVIPIGMVVGPKIYRTGA